MTTYFIARESMMTTKRSYTVGFTDEFYKIFLYTDGSYLVYEGRLFGLSYANYLRMVRDVYGGRIMGKNCLYPCYVFDTIEQAQKLATELNKRLNAISPHIVLDGYGDE